MVVADDSGCGETVASLGGGLLVPPGDAPALTAALAQLLGDPDPWREAARAAGDEVARRFGPDRVAATLQQVYAELVPGARRAPQ